MSDYTPTMYAVREVYAAAFAPDKQEDRRDQFDRWLKAHSAEVAARELRVFARAQDSWCEAGRAEQFISRRAVRDALIARAEELEKEAGL